MAYLPLSTANLPDPVIDPAQGASPEDYFNTVLYTGNGTSGRSITVGFQPDWVWVKNRGIARDHTISDAVRGAQLNLSSNTTGAEYSDAQGILSFDTNGFTVGNVGRVNEASQPIVAWNWKANGSGVTNTDGSITSTVSANTDSGFSIVSYTTATSTAGTIGHGLSQAPEMVIKKCRGSSGVNVWGVYHQATGAGGYLLLNSTAAYTANTPTWNNTAPTSSVFSMGTGWGTSDDFIAYCFHSVEGFSKFGSYVGNGSADGPFVDTGFRPSFLLIKNASASFNWIMTDSIRNTSNIDANWKWLYPHLNVAENSPSVLVDYTSNGFKLRSSGADLNGSGNTFIYMAFAEDGGPFKYSRAR